jgi:hypothetical protein
MNFFERRVGKKGEFVCLLGPRDALICVISDQRTILMLQAPINKLTIIMLRALHCTLAVRRHRICLSWRHMATVSGCP